MGCSVIGGTGSATRSDATGTRSDPPIPFRDDISNGQFEPGGQREWLEQEPTNQWELVVPDIRYVCMSDLHFGATGSILTRLETVDEVDLAHASPVLTALLDALNDLTDANESGELPTLVLVGDVLELALTSSHVAAMVFDQFVAHALARETRLFAPRIYYIPGNHDHHLWQLAREQRQYAQIRESAPGDVFRAVPHSSTLEGFTDPATMEGQLLALLIRRHPGCEDIEVVTAYPNLGLPAEVGDRVAVLHHGHFVEPMYRLVSTFKNVVFPDHEHPNDVHGWEAENHAWIDFFWSSLGQSGPAGADMTRVYEMLARDDSFELLVERVTGAIGGGDREHDDGVMHWVSSKLARAVAKRIAKSHYERERHQTSVALSPKGREGLQRYLDEPVRRQLEVEFGRVPEELVFVFGHTHKPFESLLQSGASSGPAQIFNTGGWVVDSLADDSVQGAAVVLLDERLEAVSVHCYHEGALARGVNVRTAGPEGEFFRRVRGLVDANRVGWDRVASQAAGLVRERHQVLDLNIEEGMEIGDTDSNRVAAGTGGDN